MHSDTQTTHKAPRDFLWLTLFLIIFVNGFESGGYQASLWSIGQSYDLTIASMGMFAAVELLADMLAPILLGGWADHVGKTKSMLTMLVLQLVATAAVWFSREGMWFLVAMFVLGLTTSALQFIAIATCADAYPRSGDKKIGYLTSMYALGAVVSPLVVAFYLDAGLDWRLLFLLLGLGSALALAGVALSGAEPREEAPAARTGEGAHGHFVLPAILLLCVIMAIYVGFENGFAFFVDTLFTDVFHASTGKLALSLYWAVMIPARVLVGYFARHARKILLGAVITIPCVALMVAFAPSSELVLALCVPLGLASGAIYPCVLTTMIPFAGKRTATAAGMITAATGIGGFSFTALTGLVADQWGLQAALGVLAGFFVIALAAVFGINALYRRLDLQPEA